MMPVVDAGGLGALPFLFLPPYRQTHVAMTTRDTHGIYR